MWLYLSIAHAFLFIVVLTDANEEQGCDLVALGTCAQPVVIPIPLAQKLLNNSITESRDTLCPAMDRDAFLKLVTCASADEQCAKEIFEDENPMNLTSLFAGFVKQQFTTQDEITKLLYDIICDDTCVQFLEETSMDSSDMDDDMENGESNESGFPAQCADAATDVQDELVRLLNVSQVQDPSALDLTAEEWEPYCNLNVNLATCLVGDTLGEIPSCQSLNNALDTEKLSQMMIAPIRQGNPTLSQCPDLEQKILDEIFQISSADHLKYSSLVIATVVAALFIQW